MSNPNNALPYTIDLRVGESCSICTCGRSKSLPLCDNSHRQIEGNDGDEKLRSMKITPSGDITLVLESGNYK